MILDEADFQLPGDLTGIEDEAFLGTTAEVIYLPDHVKTIGGRAFAESTTLRQIRIPGDVTEIADNAFEGSTAELIIYSSLNSKAHQYAREHGIMIGFEGNG